MGCERKSSAAKIATTSCPQDYILTVNECVKYQPVEKVKTCSIATASTEDCSGYEHAPLVSSATCEPEFSVDDSGVLCVGSESVDPIELCASTLKPFDDSCKE